MPPYSPFQNATAAPLDAVFGTGGLTVGLLTPLPTLEGHAVSGKHRAPPYGYSSFLDLAGTSPTRTSLKGART